MKYFKIIFPAILLLLSVLTLSEVKSAQAKNQLIGLCFTIADVSTQSTEMDEESVKTLRAFVQAWEQGHETRVKLTIYSRFYEPGGKLETHWISYRDRIKNPPELEKQMLNKQSGVIQVLAATNYRSNIPLMFWQSKELRVDCVMKPRKSISIPLNTETGTLKMEDL